MRFSEAALDKLEALRVDYGKPMVISSGYRCPEYNAEISRRTGRNGPHTFIAYDSIAVDVVVFGSDAYRLEQLALGRGWLGKREQQKGPRMGRFIHLDCIPPGGDHPRPWVWSY